MEGQRASLCFDPGRMLPPAVETLPKYAVSLGIFRGPLCALTLSADCLAESFWRFGEAFAMVADLGMTAEPGSARTGPAAVRPTHHAGV